MSGNRSISRRSVVIHHSLVRLAAVGILATGCTSTNTGTPATPQTTAPAPMSELCGDRAASLDVTGTGRDLSITIRLCHGAASDHEYWLVVRNSAGDYYPKGLIPPTPNGQTTKSVTLGSGTDHGSSRTFFVADAPKDTVQWMQEALQHDSDPDWGNRSALPAGVAVASNEAESTYA